MANSKLVTIFSTGDRGAIAMAKSLLEAEEIKYLVKNEAAQDLLGYGGLGGFNPVAGPIEIQVTEEDAEEAKEILKDLV